MVFSLRCQHSWEERNRYSGTLANAQHFAAERSVQSLGVNQRLGVELRRDRGLVTEPRGGFVVGTRRLDPQWFSMLTRHHAPSDSWSRRLASDA